MNKLQRELQRDLAREHIVRHCLHCAYGEPGYAVQLLIEELRGNPQELRRAVNRLWRICNEKPPPEGGGED